MRRIPLHDKLCEILGSPFSDGEDHCYFSPPASIELKYPCIIYNRTNDLDTFADNLHYQRSKRYTVTIIDEDPDSKIPDKLIELPYCSLDRNFVSDGLNHFVYTLYYDGPRIEGGKDESNDKPANGRNDR